MSNLKNRLEEFKKTFESGGPPYNVAPERVATMHRATAELKASGIEGRALKMGDRAPNFTLFNPGPCRGVVERSASKGSDGCKFLSGTLVTLLQYGAGGSKGN